MPWRRSRSAYTSNCNIVFIQEAQEDIIDLLKQKLGENYLFEFASNDPAESAIPNGLLTLIHKDWKYSNEIKIINGILDPIQGEAIQIIHIPSKKITADLIFIALRFLIVEAIQISDTKNNEMLQALKKLDDWMRNIKE